VKRSWFLPALALLGAAIAVYAVIDTNRPIPAPVQAVPPVAAPFASYVAGTGITETGRGNVAIGTAVFGVVSEIHVRVGDPVAIGDPLFKIDDRALRARLAVARAKVTEAAAALAKPRHRLGFLDRLQRKDSGAISAQMMSDARDDAIAANSVLGLAKAEAAQMEVDLARYLVRAPIPGRVLQINTRGGEYVEGGGQAKPLMLLGDDTRMYLRVDIDEDDAWRIRPDASARAYVRGNPQLQAALRFEYIEPVVTPKTSLTGQSAERSDVRVLQAIYSFQRGGLPLYLGQQMDVFIQAAPLAAAGTRGKP
jgi:RND family efflux transporter MFP subunit